MKKNNAKRNITGRIVGVLLVIFGGALLISVIIDIVNNSFFQMFGRMTNPNGYHTPLSWNILYYLRPVIGIISLGLGIKYLIGRAHQKALWVMFIALFGLGIGLSVVTRPQVYLSNWKYAPELVNTARQEYLELEKDDPDFFFSEDALYGEKTIDISRRFQNAVDTQSDLNIIAAFMVGMITMALCSFVVVYKPKK